MRTTSKRSASNGSAETANGRSSESSRWDPRVWHRKVSRPVSMWMGVFVLVGLVHPFVPESRWLLIHIFTLGVLTNSIMVWSQNLTERFLQRRLPESARPAQLTRSRLLNGGVVAVLAGQLLTTTAWHWIITWGGVALVLGAVGWHAWSVGKLIASSERSKRFRPVAWGYVASAVCLVAVGCFGAALALDLHGAWHQRVLLAHVLMNVGGFVGFAAMSSLAVLFPAMWRMKALLGHPRIALSVLGAGLALAVAGALTGSGRVLGIGILVYASAWVWSLQTWFAGVLSAITRDRITYPALSALLAVAWLVASLVVFGTSAVLIDGFLDPLSPPTLPLLVGFAAQLLIGTMSYLMPTTIGGGPAATRAGLAELNRAGAVRVTVFNLALLGWLFAPSSPLRIVCSLVACLCLVAFIPLMARGVRAQRAVIMDNAATRRKRV